MMRLRVILVYNSKDIEIMKKKILVPTDFSKNAWTALVYACDLFKERECEFYIVNVYHARGYALEHMTIPEVGVNSYDKNQ